MRLSIAPTSTCVGKVEIHDIFRVIELDAGHAEVPNKANCGAVNGPTNIAFPHDTLHAIETQLAIIVPCKDEDVSILEGVLHGIPHTCLIILVSNSKPGNFEAECALLTNYCTNAQRSALVAHQHDQGMAQAFIAAGMPQIVSDNSPLAQIRNGKGEAMIIGVALAKLVGKQFVGFVDADNLVPGSVHEYCKVYAAGLHYAMHYDGQAKGSSAPHAMVRIRWNSKPKVKNGVIVFEKSGRSSRVVNQWMNRLLKTLANGNGEHATIETGNAGEHAMSLDYALELKFATGYAVEPYQLIDTWERLGGFIPVIHQARTISRALSLYNDSASSGDEDSAYHSSMASTPATSRPVSLHLTDLPPPMSARQVRILQVETRNPHFHDTGKGADHISKMQVEGLSTIYHSRFTPQEVKEELREYVKEHLSGVVGVGEDGEPAAPRAYPPIKSMDFDVFRAEVKARATTLMVIGSDLPTLW
jgi:mannosyl-3-phosphoglycerate synthase